VFSFLSIRSGVVSKETLLSCVSWIAHSLAILMTGKILDFAVECRICDVGVL
jgi:hypothetical protein